MRRLCALLCALLPALAAGIPARPLRSNLRGRWSHAAPAAAALRAPPSDDPRERWLEQRLDHFNVLAATETGATTWLQRYFVNDTLWDGRGPVFLCVGGEGPPLEPTVVVTGDLHCADMVSLAVRHGALIVALEHRYYGASLPVPDFSTAHMQWLSSRQALGDIAHFHTFLSGQYALDRQRNRWVAWGGSYPGMLAGWSRLKFPHLIAAAVASSAPVRAEANMQGYNNVVASALASADIGGSAACLAAVRAAFAELGRQLSTPAGRR